jgi:hypothetical protein
VGLGEDIQERRARRGVAGPKRTRWRADDDACQLPNLDLGGSCCRAEAS